MAIFGATSYTVSYGTSVDATGTVEDSIYFGMTDTTGFSTYDYEGWVGMAFLNPPTIIFPLAPLVGSL